MTARKLAVSFLAGFTIAFLFLVVRAMAAEVTPQAQEQMQASGFHVADTEENEPMVQPKVGECRGKKVGTWIKNWRGDTQVGHRVKINVCAAGGRWTKIATDYAHSSPSIRWGHVWGPTINRSSWNAGIQGAMGWVFHGVIDQYYDGRVTVVAHLDGAHQIWFSKRRVWG